MSTAPAKRKPGAAPSARRDAALESAQGAFRELLGAERRVRGRDQQRDGKLSHAQVRALIALGKHEPVTAGELAKAADLNPASVTAMLDHLEAEAIVGRRRSETDRRCVHVVLTAQGRALLEEKRAAWRARWEEKLSGRSDHEIAAAADVMRDIAAILDGL
jgi:DNA-binding MarR family transcriptional regulator